jgi:hypothetical protein
MNKDDNHAGSQRGDQCGIGKGIDKQQDREHPDGGQTTLDKVAAGLAAELGVYDSQGRRRSMDEVPDTPRQTEFPVVARHLS